MSDAAPIVRTPLGSVRGVWRDDSAAFLGVPFAEPPVGVNRFGAPVPIRPWHGVRDATRFGATPQRGAIDEQAAIPEPSFPGESTLNVNVFTPAPGKPTAALPVLVWIHGGGYKAGSPSSPWYDGFSFNRDGVVTVSVSYRLGFDGFGWIGDAPQNRGLLDQIEALRWVRDNIAACGGDPGRVTIAGQSAGGGSVLALMASPLAKGLFQAAISQSGAIRPTPLAQARKVGQRLAELAAVEPTRAGFASLSEQRILELSDELVEPAPSTLGDTLAEIAAAGAFADLPFTPWLDGEVLVDDPLTAFAAGASAAVPFLLGTTAHEFTASGREFRSLVEGVDVQAALGDVLGPEAERFLTEHAELCGGPELLIGQLETDVTFRWPAVALADARGNAPTWLYDFRFLPGGAGLAGHCAELPFVWDNLTAQRVTALVGEDPPQALADAMHGAWVDFITTHRAPWRTWHPDKYRMTFDATSTVL